MFNFIIYADDTTLSNTLNTFNDNIQNDNLESLINDELLKINEWLNINKLSLNIAKYKYMTFQRTNNNYNLTCIYYMYYVKCMMGQIKTFLLLLLLLLLLHRSQSGAQLSAY